MLRNSFLALIVCASGVGIAQEGPEPRLITVTGNAMERAAPDLAVVRVGIVSQEETAMAAQDGANRVMAALLQRVTALGIDRAQIQTTQLTLSPVYSQPPAGQREQFVPRVVAYRATSTVSVRVRDFALIGRVVDESMRAGANRVDGIHFMLENDTPARLDALRNAAREARQKAEAIADALGVRLGPIHSVDEGMVSISPMPMMRAGLAEMAPTPVEPGELSIQGQVTVRFEIR